MSFLVVGNCCLKLNYLLCGSKDISTKKKKKYLTEETIVDDVSSNNQMINLNDSSRITLSKQHNINVPSSYDKLQEENCSQNCFQSAKEILIKRNCSYDFSLNSSIGYRLFDESYSTLNNEIIIKDVILYRPNPNEQLGLTLCYGITSQSTTNIYIEKVEKNSLADRQGKLEYGDQIIKINNQRVNNRDQAIQLIQGVSFLILQIIRFQFIKTNGSTITEDDSGIILAWNTDADQSKYIKSSNQLRKKSSSLSCLILNSLSKNLSCEQVPSRRCLSLNDLKINSITEEEINCSIYSLKDLIRSQSLFETTTDNDQLILKPLPFDNHQIKFIGKNLNSNSIQSQDTNRICKSIRRRRRRYREERSQKVNDSIITTDDEVISELKQGRYWTRQQRKQQFQRSKQKKKFIQTNSPTDDFNLLNRIFLRENHQELKAKPYLAFIYKKQSKIEKQKLKEIIEKYPINHYLTSQSTTNKSINSTQYYSSTIII